MSFQISVARWLVSRARRQYSPRRMTREFLRSMRAWAWFWSSYSEYSNMAASGKKPLFRYLYPCVYDKTATTVIEPTYFYQDIWAFEHIVASRPLYHVDVGSHHKYVALLSRTLPVTMVDIRPLSLPLEGLNFRKGSILEMPFEDGSVPSVSSLCVVEHIGLGRYGDPLDPDGTEKALSELKRIVAPGGNLYVSIPIDDENRTYFNAHRAFFEDYLLGLFRPFEVVEKRYIFGNEYGAERKPGFGTGCYWLRKPVN